MTDEEWLDFPTAIDEAVRLKATSRSEAISLVIALAKKMEVGSRIALEVDRSEGQPKRNVMMFDGHWRDLESLPTEWVDTGDAKIMDGYAWLGIQINMDDLKLALGAPAKAERDAGFSPFTDHERQQWIAEMPLMTADEAHKQYRQHPRFDGTKQAEFRKEWREIKKTRRGRPREKS